MDLTKAFFIECLKAGINGKTVDSLPEGLDYKELYNLCGEHALSVVVFYGLNGVKDKLPQNFLKALENAVNRHVMKDTQSNYDKELVLDEFEKRGLKHMALKGYYLKKMYPSPEMRYASDCDVLIEKKELVKVRACMKELGYEVNKYDEHHDVFFNPYTKTIFELHKMLFVGSLGKYFGVGFEKAKLEEGYKYRYRLGVEDFYLSILGHSAYHFNEGGGVGVRSVLDVFVYQNTCGDKMDRDYLNIELDECGLKKLCYAFEDLANYWFKENADQKQEAESDGFIFRLAEYIIDSTMLERKDAISASKVAAQTESGTGKAKKRAFWRIIFPKKEDIYFNYPWIKKAKIFLPLGYVLRWFRTIFKNPKNISRLKNINSVDDETLKQVKDIRDGLGINNI